MIFIAGKTCSGKTRIVNELCKRYGYKKIITYTTRPIRKGEKDGIDYHFISNEEFQKKIDSGFFAEYKTYDTEFGLWYYGVSAYDILEAGNKDIVIVTPAGFDDITIKYPFLSYRLLYIYTNISSIKRRLKKRGDNDKEAERRFEADREDFKGFEYKADKICYNNDGNDNFEQVVTYIKEYLDEYGR